MFEKRRMGSHAVIIGSGIGGLCAAQVLSRYFEKVTVLEQGARPLGKEPRKQVPQGYHLHVLLKRGEEALEQLFPGIGQAMLGNGSVLINGTRDLKWFHHGVWKKRFEGDLSILLQSRPFLEGHIRNQVEQNPHILIRYQTKALRPIFHASEKVIKGLQVQEEGSPVPTDLSAELVIDASGYGSRFQTWFIDQGYICPVEKVTINLRYISQTYQLKPEKKRDWSVLMVYPSPPAEKAGAALSRTERNRYIVTLFDYDQDEDRPLPRNAKEFIEMTKKLSQDTIYQELQGSEPLSDIQVYKVPYMIRYRYEKLQNFPKGFLFLGDTLCRFDPVFGQGMSVAAMEALALDQCLQKAWKQGRGISSDLASRYFRKISKIIDPVWLMILIEDFRHRHVTGNKPMGLTFLQWYTKRIFQRSSQDTDIYNAFVYVMNLLRPANTLFHPSVIWKALRRK
ncbi:NAD(P)-binding protein [Ammoniphilus sp. 3BR4]